MNLLESYKLARARRDPTAFLAMALLDERTSKPVRLARHQRRMVAALQRHKRTVQLAPSEFAKSITLGFYLAWRIARDPSLRVGLLSATKEQSVRLMRLIVIAMNGQAFRECFPGIAIDRQTTDEITVTGRPATMKDPNCYAGAFDLSSMLGARFDVAACDDIVTRDNSRTAVSRDQAYQSFLAVTASRLAPDGEIHCVNTAEHSDDLVHRLSRLPGWFFEKYPALDASGEATFPDRFPIERVEERRLELGPIGFQRAMMCVPVDASTLVFTAEQIDRALLNGRTAHITPVGGRVIIGVDPAWTTGNQSDLSGIVMVVIDSSGYRHVTHVEASKMNVDDLAERVVALARANKATVYCESNGAGGAIAGIIGKRVPCRPLSTTATSKRARVEALSTELASGRWAFSQPLGFPSPELKKLCSDLEVFSFDSHCGDRLSALLIACDGCRLFESKPKGGCYMLDTTRR